MAERKIAITPNIGGMYGVLRINNTYVLWLTINVTAAVDQVGISCLCAAVLSPDAQKKSPASQ